MRTTSAPTTLSVQQHTLLRFVQFGVVLLLLTPLVITKSTFFPFVVGKALYWRTLVEIVFALWVLLAVQTPSYRPPRSWLLVLLGAILACSMLAAGLGVSFQRSFWSTYERMDGVLDLVHQFAFALVVISVFRDRASWRVLLTMSLVASVAVALLAVATHLDLGVPFYGDLKERDHPRIGGVLGNATYLGSYCAVNGLLALGFLVQGLLAPGSRVAGGDSWTWATRLFWLLAAALNFYTLSLTGSRGALVGLSAGGVVLAIGAILMTRARWRWMALVALLALGGVAAGVAVSFTQSAQSSEPAGSPLLARVLGVNLDDNSSRSRLLAWRAGIEGFAARPWFGWGPDNFLAVFGRYVVDGFPQLQIHDRAHGKILEEAATKGLVGLASYLSFWAFVAFVLLRAWSVDVSALSRQDRVLALFVGAALASYFLQSQTLFDTTVLNLQYLLLVCYVAYLGTEMRPQAAPSQRSISAWLRRMWPTSVWLRGNTAPMRRIGAAVIACGALALAASGLVASASIWSSARYMVGAVTSAQPFPYIERSVAFGPLANESRLVLFGALANGWRLLRSRQPNEARRLLSFTDAEAAKAVATEPENWLIHHYLARLYRQIASTEPRYRATALRHWNRTYELAPHQNTFTGPVAVGPPLPPPSQP